MLDDLVADTRKDKKVEKRLRRKDTSDKVLSSTPFVFSSLRQKRLPRSAQLWYSFHSEEKCVFMPITVLKKIPSLI